jgi:hypothetical protein
MSARPGLYGGQPVMAVPTVIANYSVERRVPSFRKALDRMVYLNTSPRSQSIRQAGPAHAKTCKKSLFD